MEVYLESKMKSSSQLASSITREPTLKEAIIRAITEKSSGVCVLHRGRLFSVSFKLTRLKIPPCSSADGSSYTSDESSKCSQRIANATNNIKQDV